MPTLLLTHEACLAHDTGHDHPESAERLRAVVARLGDDEFSELVRREAPYATHDQLGRVHHKTHVTKILGQLPASERISLAPGTVVSPGSGEAALRAAGAVCAAVNAVASGEAANAFCAVRPPGHHAGPAQTMGFCLFNNVAIGAAHARAAHGFGRVAIIDFDVHHGNGTQTVFKRDPDTFFASIHQWFIFPKSGWRSETGVGNIVNVPLSRGDNGKTFREAMASEIYPALRMFEPEFLFISAGFDAHIGDPLGGLTLNDHDYADITRDLLEAAAELCGGRVVSVLEGGDNPMCLASSCAAHVRELQKASAAANTKVNLKRAAAAR